ncbi:MAG: hypothetical protein EP343_08830 [Deltaproteobacteria bacterium]|nr:MAG: hypothetical protein EP343_08830 [Deltaproteobacteria bacterium]
MKVERIFFSFLLVMVLGCGVSCSGPTPPQENNASESQTGEPASGESVVQDGGVSEAPPEPTVQKPPQLKSASVFPGIVGDVRVDAQGNLLAVGSHAKGYKFRDIDIPGEGFFALRLDAQGKVTTQLSGESGEGSVPFGFLTISAAYGKDGQQTLAGSYIGAFKLGDKTFPNKEMFNGIVLRLDASGKEMWSAVFPAPDLNVSVRTVVVDSQQNTWIAGVFSGTAVFGTNTFKAKALGDFFLVKLDTQGKVVSAQVLNATVDAERVRLGIDSNDNIYLVGDYSGSVTLGSNTLTAPSQGGFFVAKFDLDGKVVWAKAPADLIGGSADKIAVGPNNRIAITGTYGGALPFADGKQEERSVPSLFVTLLDADGKTVWTRSAKGEGPQGGGGVAINAKGEVYVTGSFEKTIFEGDNVLQSKGGSDGFLAKYDAKGSLLWSLGMQDASPIKPFYLSVGSAGQIFVIATFTKDLKIGSFDLKKPTIETVNSFLMEFE